MVGHFRALPAFPCQGCVSCDCVIGVSIRARSDSGFSSCVLWSSSLLIYQSSFGLSHFQGAEGQRGRGNENAEGESDRLTDRPTDPTPRARAAFWRMSWAGHPRFDSQRALLSLSLGSIPSIHHLTATIVLAWPIPDKQCRGKTAYEECMDQISKRCQHYRSGASAIDSA